MATKEVEVVKPQQNLTVKDWLQSSQFRDAVKKALPAHLTPERFIRIALTSFMKTPELANCSQESILKVMLDLSSIGLEPDGRRAHLIPFYNGKTKCKEVQLVIDYKGMIELSKRSGEVGNWRAEIVCDADVFSWENGEVKHSIDFRKPRGKAIATYSQVKNKNGYVDYEVMTIADVEAIRSRSKSPDVGPWATDFLEMAKKTVMRRHSKRLTLSPELNEALLKEDDGIDFSEETTSGITMPKRMSERPEKSETAQATLPLQDEKPSEEQIAALYALGKTKGTDPDQVATYVKQFYKVPPQELSIAQYEGCMRDFEAMT